MKFNLKFIIGVFIVLYAIITLLFFNFYKELAIKDTRQEAGSMLNNMNAIRNYVEKIQRPMIYNLLDKTDSKKFFDSRILSSTYISQYIYEKQREKKELKYTYKLVATNPLNPIHRGTRFEADILNKFRKNEMKDYFSIIDEDGESYFFIAKPISRNTKACLQCHGDPKDAPPRLIEQYGDTSGFYEKVGDLRAMIYLKIAISDIIAYHKQEFYTGGITMLAVFIVFIILIYKIYNKNIKLQSRKDKLFQHQNRLAVMGSMIGNISHQWKQPLSHLSYIFINLELLNERGKLTTKKLETKIKEANHQISFMSNTIDDFKNFFSPKEHSKYSNIEDIIRQSKRLIQASLDKYNIQSDIDIEDNFVFEGSKNEIVQIFINILNNAKDSFISNNTENRLITIKAFRINEKNTVTIENNAGQISEKIINKIFKPYFSTKDLSVATGIGLYICKVIIESYKGTISVNNTSNGVIFTIEF